VVKVSQRGSASKAFKANTSSVIWPISLVASEKFCEASARRERNEGAERGERCDLARVLVVTEHTNIVELGSGIGLLGIVLARLGAASVTLTDESMELLLENVAASGCRNAEAKRLVWAIEEDGGESWAEVKAFTSAFVDTHGARPDLILGTDLLYSQTEETFRALVSTLSELADEDTAILIGYEDRGDWSQLGIFFELAEGAGLFGESEPFSEDNEDLLLISLRKRVKE
jgi:predicted nicotinamide N-methyase